MKETPFTAEEKLALRKQRRSEYLKTPEQKEKALRRLKEWQKNNPEKTRAAQKRTRDNNRAKRNAYSRKWKLENKERVAAYHRVYNLAWGKRMRVESPVFKITCNLRTRLYLVLRGIAKKPKPTFDLVGCTAEELMRYLEARFTNGMTWENYGEWHVDHVIPCASFDLAVLENQRKCFHFSNLQPLWASHNSSKGDRLDWKMPVLTAVAG